MTTILTELDTIFISYDEPNCEENYADLLSKVPWAKRVHGVEGSDAAHKAAAELSETDRFISVDADNIVDIEFFDQEIDFEHEKFKDKVVSWSARNVINGLEYGNGGLKCWPKEYALNMKTHEAATENPNPLAQIDFCWDDGYTQMNNRYCITHNNASPLQAFRAGFREGVKMSIDSRNGNKTTPQDFKKVLWHGNLHRLLVWCSVGADVLNGYWAMLGARLGCEKTVLTDWDYREVRDFKWINNYFIEQAKSIAVEDSKHNQLLSHFFACDHVKLSHEVKRLGHTLRRELDLDIGELDATNSRFFKATQIQLPRTGQYVTEQELEELRKINK
jgi:hypothetical protein